LEICCQLHQQIILAVPKQLINADEDSQDCIVMEMGGYQARTFSQRSAAEMSVQKSAKSYKIVE
jgi:hypothetical protein